MGKIQKEYQCSLQLAIDILGGKWKMRILWYLRNGPMRYSCLMRKMTDISQKTLTQQLRELEDADIISRKVFAEVPPHVEYYLTSYGERLETALSELSQWSHSYADDKQIRLRSNYSAENDPEESDE